MSLRRRIALFFRGGAWIAAGSFICVMLSAQEDRNWEFPVQGGEVSSRDEGLVLPVARIDSLSGGNWIVAVDSSALKRLKDTDNGRYRLLHKHASGRRDDVIGYCKLIKIDGSYAKFHLRTGLHSGSMHLSARQVLMEVMNPDATSTPPSPAEASGALVNVESAGELPDERGMTVVSALEALPRLELDIPDYHLLTIGIDDYQHWPNLKTATYDARSVATVLQEFYGFPAENITRLLGADATERGILEALRKYALRLDEGDALVIYYAGHGHLDEVTNSGAWIPVDGELGNESNWIPNEVIKSYLRAINARHILLISDSCFSGKLFRNSGMPEREEVEDDYVRRAFRKNARQILTSGSLEPVADEGFSGNSVFTYFLLRALRGHDRTYLAASELFVRIRGGVAANAPQQPLLGLLDGTGGEIGGEFVFVREFTSAQLRQAIASKRESVEALEAERELVRQANEGEMATVREQKSELDQLDAEIEELRAQLKLGERSEGDLQDLTALVDRREAEAARLEELKSQRVAEAAARQAEIEKLRKAAVEQRQQEFEADYAAYLKIEQSQHADDALRLRAWDTLCRKWRISGASPDKPMPLRWDRGTNRVQIIRGDG